MASTANNDPQQQQQQQLDRVASPPQQALPPPPPKREVPDPPLPRPVTSDSEGMSQNRTSTGIASLPTNPTTVTSIPRDKSEPNSIFEHPPPIMARMPSVSGHEHEIGRYPSVMRPRPVLSLDPNAQNANGSRLQVGSGLEWIVPAAERRREKTVAERLQPTLDVACAERDKYASKARYTGMALNCAIGLQVVVGALTTGVAASTTGKATSIGVSILGGVSTTLASYLAKMRGSNEPDFSNLRSRELDTFIREIEAWVMDKGHLVGADYDAKINRFRERYEEIVRTAGEDPNSSGFDSHHKPIGQPGQGPNQFQGNGPFQGNGQFQGNPKAYDKV